MRKRYQVERSDLDVTDVVASHINTQAALYCKRF